MRVLIVEDEEAIRTILKQKFVRMGYDLVVTAENGADGLKKFQTHTFDLVLTDLVMPVMGGQDMAEAIKKLDSTIPIAVLSSHSIQPGEFTCFDAILQKPIVLGELAGLVELIRRP